MKPIFFLLPALLAITAASDNGLGRKKYQVPIGAGVAIASFPKGNLRLSIKRGDTQYYGVLAGDTCKSAQKLTVYSAGIGGNTTAATLPIEAGRKVRVIATIQKQNFYGVGTELFTTCTRIAEFTPSAGSKYAITQEADASRADFCSVSVKDDSGAAPADVSNISSMQCRF